VFQEDQRRTQQHRNLWAKCTCEFHFIHYSFTFNLTISFSGRIISFFPRCNGTRECKETSNQKFNCFHHHIFISIFLWSFRYRHSAKNEWNFKFSFPRWNCSWRIGFEFDGEMGCLFFFFQTGNNYFGDKGCVNLVEGLKKNKSLKILGLESISLYNTSLLTIFQVV